MLRLTRESLDLLDTQVGRLAALDLGGPSEPASPRPSGERPRSRLQSATPSATSVSDGEYEFGGDESDRDTATAWLHKGKARDTASPECSLASTLPPELLIAIFRYLPTPHDLATALLVSRTWSVAGFGLLWHRPAFSSVTQFASFVRSLSRPEPTHPYARHVRRLNLTAIAPDLSDELIVGIAPCVRVERLVLTGATRLSKWALRNVVADMPNLLALDLSHVAAIDDALLDHVATRCSRLQGLNLTGCKLVGDDGVRALANCRALRRLKMAGCHRLTDNSLVAIARSCAHLLELDLANVPQVTDDTIFALLLNCCHLRELRLNHNENITSAGFPNLAYLASCSEQDLREATLRYAWYLSDAAAPKAKARLGIPPPDLAITSLRPTTPVLEQLRLVDLTACPGFDDAALANLVTDAPKLRNLTLAKCPRLTDAAADSLARIGRHLHYLHLGHVVELTDAGVIRIAQACTRLRYVDLACCTNITDESISHLAENLTKLRRIGLVKVLNVTDDSLYALSIRFATLERMHLSYCDKISITAVAFMLNRLVRLTHLSLTGVTAFKTPEFQRFCRPAPSEFNAHQQASFCVFSGHGVAALRKHLNKRAAARIDSDGTSTRRGSDSSLSSSTVPGLGASPSPSPVPWTDMQTLPPSDDGYVYAYQPRYSHAVTHGQAQGSAGPSLPASSLLDNQRPWTGVTPETTSPSRVPLAPTPRPHPARTARESLATLLGRQRMASHASAPYPATSSDSDTGTSAGGYVSWPYNWLGPGSGHESGHGRGV